MVLIWDVIKDNLDSYERGEPPKKRVFEKRGSNGFFATISNPLNITPNDVKKIKQRHRKRLKTIKQQKKLKKKKEKLQRQKLKKAEKERIQKEEIERLKKQKQKEEDAKNPYSGAINMW